MSRAEVAFRGWSPSGHARVCNGSHMCHRAVLWSLLTPGPSAVRGVKPSEKHKATEGKGQSCVGYTHAWPQEEKPCGHCGWERSPCWNTTSAAIPRLQICMRICVFVCTCIYVCICICVCVLVYLCLCVHACKHVHVCVCMVYACTCMYTCVYVYACICMGVYVHAYAQVYGYVFMCTRVCTCA